jgi:hypothetical protein
VSEWLEEQPAETGSLGEEPRLDLPGPSKPIRVEPIEEPGRRPVEIPDEPGGEPETSPDRDREPVEVPA